VAIPDSILLKTQLRQEIRRTLRDDGHNSQNVCETLIPWLAARPELRIIATFAALPDEVDLAALIEKFPDRCWVFPRVAGDDLTLHVVHHPASELVTGAFGILEPAVGLAEIAVDRIDAFFCPGLAFDLDGGRLGRGRGFYDRMLVRARPDSLKIGVCFNCQMVSDTFSEPHDVRMNVVVSEQQVVVG
jgi:5-formyltetrahydrofolate cyclo-ligase